VILNTAAAAQSRNMRTWVTMSSCCISTTDSRPPPPAPAPDRVAEAAKACGILKARPLYAGQIDGEAIVDAEHSDRFRALLEAERPHLVFTHWPIDNHADHRAISMLVYDACCA